MPLKFLADQNFNQRIVRGMLRLAPQVDIVHAYEEGLARTEDPMVLAWAAEHNRVVLTHDVTTMTLFATARVEQGLPMPGLFLVQHPPVAMASIIGDLVLLAECSTYGEWEGQQLYLPLR